MVGRRGRRLGVSRQCPFLAGCVLHPALLLPIGVSWRFLILAFVVLVSVVSAVAKPCQSLMARTTSLPRALTILPSRRVLPRSMSFVSALVETVPLRLEVLPAVVAKVVSTAKVRAFPLRRMSRMLSSWTGTVTRVSVNSLATVNASRPTVAKMLPVLTVVSVPRIPEAMVSLGILGVLVVMARLLTAAAVARLVEPMVMEPRPRPGPVQPSLPAPLLAVMVARLALLLLLTATLLVAAVAVAVALPVLLVLVVMVPSCSPGK